ncbi:putative 26 proteasome complex subunit Sem1 [Obelidium mucronatum]|nr:putative 26 proteasome complex subunit Sem1 [Obelidium mucronatum]
MAKETKPEAKVEETKKKQVSTIEEDDEFEDFPAHNKEVIDWSAVEAAERELNAWEDVWEDDDEAEDFAVLLAAEKKKNPGAAPMKH